MAGLAAQGVRPGLTVASRREVRKSAKRGGEEWRQVGEAREGEGACDNTGKTGIGNRGGRGRRERGRKASARAGTAHRALQRRRRLWVRVCRCCGTAFAHRPGSSVCRSGGLGVVCRYPGCVGSSERSGLDGEQQDGDCIDCASQQYPTAGSFGSVWVANGQAQNTHSGGTVSD